MANHYADERRIYERQECRANTGTARAGMEGLVIVMGIDPGPTHSAYCLVRHDYSIVDARKVPNAHLDLDDRTIGSDFCQIAEIAIEGLACYGRPVGKETFETAYMVGRVLEQADRAMTPCTIYHRPEYANAIAGTGKVTDAVLYQALRLRFGEATKGGPLYVLKGESDLRSAYAVAVYHLDVTKRGRK